MNETTIRLAPKKSPSAATRSNRAAAKSIAGHVSAEDSAEACSQLILAAIVAFRDGDFSARLPVGWTGTDGRIAEAFNQTIAKKQRISTEIARLTTAVGKDGRLRQRMSLPGVVGEWAAE